MAKRREKASRDKPERKTFAPIRKALSDIGRSCSEGSDKMADIVLDKSEETRTGKAGKIKDEAISMVGEIVSSLKTHLRLLTPKGVLWDASYEVGRFSRGVKNTCVEILDDLIE